MVLLEIRKDFWGMDIVEKRLGTTFVNFRLLYLLYTH